jgi:uncharacterized protein involved in response to NO
MAAIPRVRPGYAGPALFSYGFRPFFLAGAAWAFVAIGLWMLLLFGAVSLPTAFTLLDWHIHEMLYGYLAAVVAGFLLTAIPNWTGRLPVAGLPLAGLAALWLSGRVAVACSEFIGAATAAVIDLSFLLALLAACLREIIAGRNWRNLRVLAVVAVLFVGNAVFHVEVIATGAADFGTRFGVAAAIGLIMLIGGRIIPSFTRNWLARQGSGRLPQPFSAVDGVALVLGATALFAWIAAPQAQATGAGLIAAGLVQAVRLGRWAGERTVPDRLVLILHVGYAFVPLGFVLTGAAVVWPQVLPASAGIHAWTAGAIAVMTLAVMTRATLGHTGRPLAASGATQVLYALAVLAALLRIAASLVLPLALLYAAAFAWLAAFAVFLAVYAPMLLGPRAAPRAAARDA